MDIVENDPAIQDKNRYKKFTEGGKPHRFVKGVSGNPKGRPKGRGFLDVAQDFLDSGMEVDGDEPVTMDVLVRAVILQALSGNGVALRELLARIEPAPQYNLNINNNVNAPSDEMLTLLDTLRKDTEGLDRNEQGRLLESASKDDDELVSEDS